MPDPSTVVTWPAVVTIALGSSVVGTVLSKALERGASRTETLRTGYADATRALNAWGQFPLRIQRRTDDEPETLARLEALGAEIQSALAYSTGWVGAESAELGELYNQLLQVLRAEVTVHARLAWSTAPARTGEAMNLAGPRPQPDTGDLRPGELPAEWLVVQLFSSAIQYRIGWRRYLWIRPLLRRRLSRMGIVAKAEDAFGVRSARRLNARQD
ncbi:hypothetical protein [Kribbella sp. NPDC051137]|uniref:hypothetical protein n=1 Tax=Kribbella sp. NPDC051137 TaxID=3155045 RepID=UPI0034300AC9